LNRKRSSRVLAGLIFLPDVLCLGPVNRRRKARSNLHIHESENEIRCGK